MKKILALVTVLALVAALVVPMAVSAAGTAAQVGANGSIVAATVSIAYPGPTLSTNANIPFGMLVVGRNPAGSAWDTTTGNGAVTVTNNSDPNPTWTVSAFSDNDGGGNFANGKMWCDALARPLDDAMYVSSDNGATSAQLPVGVTLTGSVNTTFKLSAAQIVSQNDVNQGAGLYYIVVQLTASIAP